MTEIVFVSWRDFYLTTWGDAIVLTHGRSIRCSGWHTHRRGWGHAGGRRCPWLSWSWRRRRWRHHARRSRRGHGHLRHTCVTETIKYTDKLEQGTSVTNFFQIWSWSFQFARTKKSFTYFKTRSLYCDTIFHLHSPWRNILSVTSHYLDACCQEGKAVVRVEVHHHPVGLVSLHLEAWPYWGALLEASTQEEEQEGKRQEVAGLHRDRLDLQVIISCSTSKQNQAVELV